MEINMNKLINRITSNPYLFSILNKLISILCGVITTSLINRYLGPSLRGEYAYIINIINIVVVIGNLGIYQSYGYNKRNKMNNQTNEYLNIFSLQAIIYTIVALVLSIFIDKNVYIIALILVPMEILSQQLGMIALIEFIKFRQKLSIIFIFINLILTILVYIIFSTNVLYILSIGLIKNSIYIIIYMLKFKYIPNPFNVNFKILIKLIRFGFYPMLTALLINLNYKIDVFIMSFFLTNTQVGLYSVGATLAEYAWIVPDAFKEVLFSRTVRDDSLDEIILCIKVCIAISLIMFFSILILGKFIITILYGNEFIDSYRVSCIIFLGIPSMILYKLISPLYVSKGENRFYFNSLLLSVLTNTLLNFIFIPIMGKEGAAISSILSYSVSGYLFLSKFLKEYKLKWHNVIFIQKDDLYKFRKYINKNKKIKSA